MFTQEEILEMARQAGFEDFDKWVEHYPKETKKWCERMEAFAKLVYAKAMEREREACAKIVEESSLPDAYSEPCLLEIANEIRERGQQ